jgi:hypothetical protein
MHLWAWKPTIFSLGHIPLLKRLLGRSYRISNQESKRQVLTSDLLSRILNFPEQSLTLQNLQKNDLPSQEYYSQISKANTSILTMDQSQNTQIIYLKFPICLKRKVSSFLNKISYPSVTWWYQQ